MTFIKKMCILRQVKQGFSGDGKTLSGLIKIEQYGKNVSVEVSVINFAPLKSGEYYCLIADSKQRTEMLPLRGKSIFNILTELDFSGGFCGVICFVKNGVTPIAYGVNGSRVYDWRTLVKNTVAPAADDGAAFTLADEPIQAAEPSPEKPPFPEESTLTDAETTAKKEKSVKKYDDESVVTENYYEKREDGADERFEHEKACGNAHSESGDQNKSEKAGQDAQKNVDAESVRDTFKTEPDGYYLAVKSEIDELFQRYPADGTLKSVFAHSEWVRIQEEGKAEYLVGVIYEDLRAKYICYALPTSDKDNPPEEIASVCTFVPSSLFEEKAGFFVIFQSCATGECIRPESI
ncbi:MAG: hypothetical protein IJY62_04660 [Clostridia bacterium]|nr:hypothetical protein [Clostridia bacterium]